MKFALGIHQTCRQSWQITVRLNFLQHIKMSGAGTCHFSAVLEESSICKNPFKQFANWFDLAKNTSAVSLPQAMTLSTVKPNGKPAARMVILQGFNEEGFRFYTSSCSAKASDLEKTPFAALVLYWAPLNRSIRIEGKVEKVPSNLADADFNERPRQSQLSAHLGDKQSLPIENREILVEHLSQVDKLYEGQHVPRPSFWEGYIVKPDLIEFWQGNKTRICDRIVFTKHETSNEEHLSSVEDCWIYRRLG